MTLPSLLADVAGSRIPLSVVRSSYPGVSPLIHELLADDVLTRCLTAVSRGKRPTPGVPVDAWLRGFAAAVAQSRDVRAMAARLGAVVPLDHVVASDLAWSSPTDTGVADDLDVDEATALHAKMPTRWRTSIHGQATCVGVGLSLPAPEPVWDPDHRARLADTIARNPDYAARDLAVYPHGADPALFPVWTSLGPNGRSMLSLPSLPPSRARTVIATVALDRVTPWPRPSRRRLDGFVAAITTPLPPASRTVVAHAAAAWIDTVFEPVATHAVRALDPPPPAPTRADVLTAFDRAARLDGSPCGDTPDAVAHWLSSHACSPPHTLQVAALPC